LHFRDATIQGGGSTLGATRGAARTRKNETPRGSPPNSPRRGRNTSARGNAPGTEQVVNPDPCPERAIQVGRCPESCVALPGLGVEGIPRGPRALPWADVLRPFGAEIPSSPGPNRVVFGKKSRKNSRNCESRDCARVDLVGPAVPGGNG